MKIRYFTRCSINIALKFHTIFCSSCYGIKKHATVNTKDNTALPIVTQNSLVLHLEMYLFTAMKKNIKYYLASGTSTLNARGVLLFEDFLVFLNHLKKEVVHNQNIRHRLGHQDFAMLH